MRGAKKQEKLSKAMDYAVNRKEYETLVSAKEQAENSGKTVKMHFLTRIKFLRWSRWKNGRSKDGSANSSVSRW
ncbi:MAG: hypothetical protein ACLSD6_02220 [Clostridium sp.]